MTTRTWNNLAGGSWTAGVNWAGGAAPVAGDDAVINQRGIAGYTISLPTATYALNSLTLAAKGTTVALNGSTVNAATTSFTSGTLKGGALSSPNISLGASTASSDVATLDGMTISGAVHVGTVATPASLNVQNGLTFTAPGTVMEFAGTSSGLNFSGNNALTNAAVIVDAGARVVMQGGTAATMNIGSGNSVDVRGDLSLGTGLTLAAPVHVAGGGSLTFASTATIGAAARLTVDANSIVYINENLTTDQFNAFANQTTKAAGATEQFFGTLTNTGRTLDLTAGGAAAKITENTASVVGGTLANTGAKTALEFADLTGVTLRGAFAADAQVGGGLTVRNSFVVTNSDGSAGTLDLASTPTALAIKAPTDGSNGPMVLSNMTILASGISSDVVTYLAPTTNVIFGVTGGIYGTIVNQGTVKVADNTGAVLATGVAAVASTPGRFENDGTLTIGAGDQLDATGGAFVNKGTLNLGTGAVASFASGAVLGTVNLAGKDSLALTGTGTSGQLNNFVAGDSLYLTTGLSGAGGVTVSGQTLTVTQAGGAVGSFTLNDPTGAAYDASQFSEAVQGGVLVLTTTHGQASSGGGGGGGGGTGGSGTGGGGSTGGGSTTIAPIKGSPIASGGSPQDPLFDRAFYLAHNPDVAASGVDPYQHYMTSGWHKGRDPSALFSTSFYLAHNPDVAAAGINPLLHFEQSGWHEGRDPSPGFSDGAYLKANPDVAAAGIDPLLHYVQSGEAEGRARFLSTSSTDPLVNVAYVDTVRPDVAAAGVDAAAWFHASGWHEGTNPDPLFDVSYYLSHNPDVAAAHVDPLLHYEQSGWHEGRNPSAAFSTNAYLQHNPDVAAAGIDPLVHYLQSGQAEGRAIYPA